MFVSTHVKTVSFLREMRFWVSEEKVQNSNASTSSVV